MLIGGQINVIIAKAGIWFFITILYSFIIIPVYYIALANMASNNSKLTAAFRIRDVFNKIASIGLKNLIAFYIVTIIPFYPIVYIADVFRMGIFSLIIYLLISLMIIPYLSMYLNRIVALFYMSE